MQADLPHTLYLRDTKSGGAKKKRAPKVNKDDNAFKLQQEAIRKAQAKREAKRRGEAPYTMNELFKK
jgi:hypothetical protein